MGLAIARQVAQAGARVVIDGRSEDKLRQAVSSILGEVESKAIDVTGDDSVKAFFAGPEWVDHLAITASPGGRSGFGASSVEEAHTYGGQHHSPRHD